ncbi:unnamed protein product [Mucor hiemalis]
MSSLPPSETSDIIRPTASKSVDTKQSSVILPEKSTSLTLAERRRNIPASLKLPAAVKQEEEKKVENTMESTLSSQVHGSTISLCKPSLKIQNLYAGLVSEVGAFDKMIEKDGLSEPVVRILKAYSVYDVRIGYHPHLATLVESIVQTNIPEDEAFAVFVRLMETYDMRLLYMLNMEGLDLLLQKFHSFFTSTCPDLESHFSKLSIQPASYAKTWFLTLFRLTPVVMRLVFLQGAVQTAMRAAIHVLKAHTDTLLGMQEPSDILEILNSRHELTETDIKAIDISGLDLSLEVTPKLPKRKASNHAVPLLKQQLQDVVMSLSQLQKEHTLLNQENKALRMREMDGEATQLKLQKRNAVLEKRVKKYKVKLANAVTMKQSTSNKTEDEDTEEDTLQKFSSNKQFSSFVASLRDSGDFGALIAGALAPVAPQTDMEDTIEQLDVARPLVVEETNGQDTALQNVTSELVQVKLDHFETCQKYQSLLTHCQDLTAQLNSMQESQTSLCQKVIYLESELEDVIMERDQIYADQEEVLSMAMVAKKTSAELQSEKMALTKELEKLESDILHLQQEKQAYFMPRDSFSEEVFAAHTILFAPKKKQQQQPRRLTITPQDDYKDKFVESELRCRELEKYLAETKVRLAELESTVGMSTPRRTASFNMNKRNSTTSLSMLANRTTSPIERRESTESYASSTTSLASLNSSTYTASKRSSVYSRIWSAFGSPPPTPTTVAIHPTSKNNNTMILCTEDGMV